MDFTTWKVSDFAAWWGAFIATFLLVWDVVKWITAGARLKLRVQYDMILVNHPNHDGDIFIIVSVVNRGTLPATITQLAGTTYQNKIKRWLRKSPKAFVVIQRGELGSGIPFLLEPGREWQGFISQNSEMEKNIKSGNLEIWVSHTASNRWIRTRIKPKKKIRKIVEG